MKRITLALLFTAALLGLSACKSQTNDKDAIRAGILQHLNSIGTLNMSAIEMDMRSVSVAGNLAHAEVEFRVKTSGPPGGGMQHPNTNQNSSANQPVHSMPNFNEILNPPSSASSQTTLPPGHPPVSSSRAASAPASQDQPSAKKPR